MLRNDYLMRLIEQYIRAIALIKSLKMAKNHKKALTVVQDTVMQIFGVDAKFIDTIPEEDLLLLLEIDGKIDPDRAVMLAGLQRITAEIYEEQDELDAAYFAYLKSLTLYLEVFIQEGDTLFPGYISEIEPLISKLEDYDLPWPVKKRLWRYYEKTGKYSKAEDMLYELMEDKEPETEILHQGIDFYERLLFKDDLSLNRGNLPREEVEEGLAKLRITINSIKGSEE